MKVRKAPTALPLLIYDDFESTVTPKPGQRVSNTNYPTENAKETNFGAKIINGIRFGYTF